MFAAMDGERPNPGAATTSLTVLLREASVEDAEAIEAVHFSSREAVYRGRVAQWPPAGPDRVGRVRRWQEWLSAPEIDCLVVERDDEIVGFCTIRPSADADVDATEVAEMPTLYVRPDAWRRGVGSLLCNEAIERTTAGGFHVLTLWVLEINTEARAFYEAFGFRPDGGRKVDEGSAEGLMADRYRIGLSQGPAE